MIVGGKTLAYYHLTKRRRGRALEITVHQSSRLPGFPLLSELTYRQRGQGHVWFRREQRMAGVGGRAGEPVQVRGLEKGAGRGGHRLWALNVDWLEQLVLNL